MLYHTLFKPFPAGSVLVAKSVKVSEDAYRKAEKLAEERGESVDSIVEEGIRLVEGREKLLEAAGSWEDIDADKLIKEIYEGRKLSTRPEVKF